MKLPWKVVKEYFRPTPSWARKYPWGLLLLSSVGLLTCVGFIVLLFLPLGKLPDSFHATGELTVDSPAFLTTISRTINAPIERGGDVRILENGDEFLPALLEDIQAAERTINFTVYIWSDGEMSDQVMAALLAKQKEGVEVRILLDGVGSQDADDDIFNELRDAGGKVEVFRGAAFGKLSRYHRRTHRRAIVIDGRIGYTGGMSVADTWLGDARNSEEWRDLMFRVTDRKAQALQGHFAELWTGSTGEIITGASFYPLLDTTEGSTFVSISSSPAEEAYPLPNVNWLSIYAAQEYVYIVTPYFIPDEALREILIAKARTGVDVRIMLPGEHTDRNIVRAAGENYYTHLLEGGVKIYEYEQTFLHSKFLVADGEWSIIGSQNINSRSRLMDQENVLGIQDPGLASELAAIFHRDLEVSNEITVEEWEDRGIIRRVMPIFARPFANQF